MNYPFRSRRKGQRTVGKATGRRKATTAPRTAPSRELTAKPKTVYPVMAKPKHTRREMNPVATFTKWGQAQDFKRSLLRLNPKTTAQVQRRAMTSADERYFLRQRTAVGPFYVRPAKSTKHGDDIRKLDSAIIWAHRESWDRPGQIVKVMDSQGTVVAMVRDGKEIGAAEWIERNPNPSRLDQILDAVEAGQREFTLDVRDYTEDQKRRIIDAAQARGLDASSDGNYILIRDLRRIHTPPSPRRAKRNPNGGAADADKLYQDFHGRPSTKTTEVHTKLKSRERLSELGDLVELRVITPTGKKATLVQDDTGMWQPSHQKQPSYPDVNRNTPMLSSSPDRRQLYIEGGVQEVELGLLGLGGDWKRDNMLLGILTHVTYRTEKGFDKFQLTDYYHKLGEETGDEPVLTYDTLNGLLAVVGGRYEVRPEGIVN